MNALLVIVAICVLSQFCGLVAAAIDRRHTRKYNARMAEIDARIKAERIARGIQHLFEDQPTAGDAP